MSANSQPDVKEEFQFVIEAITSVLSCKDSRELLFDLASDLEAGADLGQAVAWDFLGPTQIAETVKVAVAATLCRILIRIVRADRKITSEELKFAATALNPYLPILVSANADSQLPTAIANVEDFRVLARILDDAPKSLFSAAGIGGRSTSLLRFCSLCDPFVEYPLLPVFLFVAREIYVSTASVGGISDAEQKVIENFDALTDRCEGIATEVSARLPQAESFETECDSDSPLSAIMSCLKSVKREETRRRRELKTAYARASRIIRRLDSISRRSARYIGDAWDGSTAFLLFACACLGIGVGAVFGGIAHSIVVGVGVGICGSCVAVHLVVERLLNLSWYSTVALQAELRQLRRRRFQIWKELSACDKEIDRLNALRVTQIALETARQAELRRQQVEREQRQRAMASYFVRPCGPIHVRAYVRRDGTYVRSHFRRR